MQIPRDFIDELLARTDITELVGSYVRLSKSGSNTKGLCPFHTEKTPSFSVNADMQIYKCFGCGKGGNALTFIMEIENLPFVDAVQMLARRAGMTVPEQEGHSEYINKRKRILELNREAAKHFYKMLSAPGGEKAREYLARRAVTKASVTKFGLGAAPDDWSLLYDAMSKKGYSKQDLLDAGLCKPGQKSGGVYDFFRDRLIFPVIDVHGNVIAFSGRALSDDAKGPKYLNSPDTIAFHKGRNLFALNLAKKTKEKMIILVEGNFDAVMLHQAGFDCAVAQLGSAFTPEQARLLASYTDNIILAFDADEAGRKATLKALPLIEATGKSVKVLELEDGDPDDYIKTHGAEALRTLIRHSENQTEYRLQVIGKNNDTSTDAGRLAYLASATEYLATIPSLPEREIYSVKVAKTAGVSAEAVKNEINRVLKKKQWQQGKNTGRQKDRPREAIQPASRNLRYKNEASAVAEEGVVRCLMKEPALISIINEKDFKPDEFTSEFLANVFTLITERISGGDEIKPSLIMGQMEADEASHLTSIFEKPESLSNCEKALREYIGKIRTERYKNLTPSAETLLEIAKLKRNGDTVNG